jgi:hypothetical protein
MKFFTKLAYVLSFFVAILTVKLSKEKSEAVKIKGKTKGKTKTKAFGKGTVYKMTVSTIDDSESSGGLLNKPMLIAFTRDSVDVIEKHSKKVLKQISYRE